VYFLVKYDGDVMTIMTKMLQFFLDF